jgi:hypothetical protein
VNGTLRAITLALEQSHEKSIKIQQEGEVFLTTQDKDTLQGWHNRLGCMDVRTIKKLVQEEQLHITDKDTSPFKMEECDTCAVANTACLTFDNVSVCDRRLSLYDLLTNSLNTGGRQSDDTIIRV